MLPLEGVTVLDLSRVLAGPLCSMRLADLGARIIKVESPGLGDPTRGFGPPFVDGESPYYQAYNRGKESVVLDLKSPVGRTVLERLVERSDILLENFRPGVMSRLGFGDEALWALNADILHVSITGYPADSGRGGDPAFDLAIQAESGLLAMTGEDDVPCRVPISLADVAAALTSVEGVLAALLAKARGRVIRRVEVSLIESLCALFGYQSQSTLMTEEAPRPLGHRHANLVPYRAMATADGWLVLAIATDEHWQRLLGAEGISPSLARGDYVKNKGRVEGRDELECILEEDFMRATTEEWVARLKGVDVPVGVVRTLDDVLSRGAVGLQTYVREDRSIPMVASPLRIDGERIGTTLAPPRHGDHTAAVLEELSSSAEELEAWREALS